MLELKTEYLFDAHFSLSPPSRFMRLGNVGWGIRGIAPAVGGTFEGPRLKGVLKDFGGAWFLVRPDGVFWVEARGILETHDGALISIQYDGIYDLTEQQIKGILTGSFPGVPVRFHAAPRFETGHEEYLWLNKVMTAAVGEVRFADQPPLIHYSVYALR